MFSAFACLPFSGKQSATLPNLVSDLVKLKAHTCLPFGASQDLNSKFDSSTCLLIQWQSHYHYNINDNENYVSSRCILSIDRHLEYLQNEQRAKPRILWTQIRC